MGRSARDAKALLPNIHLLLCEQARVDKTPIENFAMVLSLLRSTWTAYDINHRETVGKSARVAKALLPNIHVLLCGRARIVNVECPDGPKIG